MFFTYGKYDVNIKKENTMSTKNNWFIGAGIVIGLIVLFALPFVWQTFFHAQGFGMMGGGTGFGFSPMRGGMGFGMSFMWLIPIALLTLVGLSIAALIKYLRTPSAK
jgi:hypothetical protein